MSHYECTSQMTIIDKFSAYVIGPYLLAMGSSYSNTSKQLERCSSCSEDLCNYQERQTRFNLMKLPVSLVEHLSSSRRSSNLPVRCSIQKPLSKNSRKRRFESTVSSVSGVFKTAWPVKICESLFLPEFRIKGGIDETNFKMVEEIGRGAYSIVYKVMLMESGQEYAMKVLSKAKVIEEDSVSQVKEEAMIQSSCGHHPFITNCLYYWQNRHLLFIVSEYFCGGELWHLLNKYRSLPEDIVRIYIAELALALDFLHNAGVIYRDMKLENVVLDVEGHVRLIDFGLSKWLKYGARTTTLCGTLQFIAPEVFEGSYGHAADWWSLGVVSCLLITGEKAQEKIQ